MVADIGSFFIHWAVSDVTKLEQEPETTKDLDRIDTYERWSEVSGWSTPGLPTQAPRSTTIGFECPTLDYRCKRQLS